MVGIGRGGSSGGRGYVYGAEHFAYQTQNMMITSLWMTQGTQCCNADLKFFRYYKHKHDTALGKFLVDNCFNPNLKCQNVNCKRSARDHVLSFVHNHGRVDITVGWLKFDLAAAAQASAAAENVARGGSGEDQGDGDDDDDDTTSWPDSDTAWGSSSEQSDLDTDNSGVILHEGDRVWGAAGYLPKWGPGAGFTSPTLDGSVRGFHAGGGGGGGGGGLRRSRDSAASSVGTAASLN
ncbi:unnamed protein product, partial [Ectocarpus fasciculatus]